MRVPHPFELRWRAEHVVEERHLDVVRLLVLERQLVHHERVAPRGVHMERHVVHLCGVEQVCQDKGRVHCAAARFAEEFRAEVEEDVHEK